MSTKKILAKALGYGIVLLVFLNVAFDFLGFEGPLVSVTFWGMWAVILGGCAYAVIKQHMLVYLVKRVLEALFTLFVIASVTFVLLRFLPGGPFDTEKALPPEIKANIEAKYNLNAPLYEQYGLYLWGLVRGDLGASYKYIGRPVVDIITDSAPVTFKLGFYALIVAFVVGIPLGVIAANKHNTWLDNSAMSLAISGVALPSFLVAALLILVFGIKLQWLPVALWDSPAHYVMPVMALGLRPASIIARLTRSSVLDVIRADYVRTAWAKGLSEKVVLFKHVLRNSLIPVISISGPLVANVLSGSFVIEIVFAIPGMGRHLVQSVNNRDYPLILGFTLLYSFMLIGANLLVDLLYAVVDPRIKLA